MRAAQIAVLGDVQFEGLDAGATAKGRLFAIGNALRSGHLAPFGKDRDRCDVFGDDDVDDGLWHQPPPPPGRDCVVEFGGCAEL